MHMIPMFGSRTSAWLVALLVLLAGCAAFPGMEKSTSGSTPTGLRNGATPATEADSTLSVSAGFREVSAARGFNYTSTTQTSNIVNGGVYVIDYNSDKWPDLLVVGGAGPVLFENTAGEFQRAGLLPPINATIEGAHVFDYDNDGWEDLLLLAQDHTPILLENEGGELVRRRGAFPVNLTYPIGATSADYNGDGCLDVFVTQYADWAEKQPVGVQDMSISGTEDNGNSNYLFRGNCSDSFVPANGTAISGAHWSLAASFVDFTGNGQPDIHVANDFNNDRFYINRGNGTFKRVTMGDQTNRNAMSSEVGDVNGDGRFDLFVTNIYLPELIKATAGPFAGRMHGNNLLLNRGNGTFDDVASEWNVKRGGWGWAAVLADFDNDGYQELFQTTKRMPITSTGQSQINKQGLSVDEYLARHPSIRYPRYYERSESGQTFFPSPAASSGFKVASGTGVARLDFDRDGNLDLAVAQVDGRFLLYENTLRTNHTNWLRIEVRGSEEIPATGSRVVVTTDGRVQNRLVNSRTDYLSQDSRIVHVGIDDAKRVDRVRVVWPDGSEIILTDLAINQRIIVAPHGRTDT